MTIEVILGFGKKLLAETKNFYKIFNLKLVKIESLP